MSRGRVVRREETSAPGTGTGTGTGTGRPTKIPTGRARIIERSIVEAHDEARGILDAAKMEAVAIAKSARETLEKEVRAEGDTRVAAALLALRDEDERRAERDLARLVDTAVALAERLLGETLALDPARIRALAEAALTEAKGARRVAFEANPLDAATLQAQLQALGLSNVSVEAREDLARGDLVLRTELGTLDARLKPQLQRLADALSRARRERAG